MRVHRHPIIHLLLIAIILVTSMFFLSACKKVGEPKLSNEAPERTADSGSPSPSAVEEPQPVEEAPQPYSKEAKLIAVGDIMMHSPQIPAGYDPETKTYNYDAFFSEVKSILSSGDWVLGNLETPLAGEEAGYSGYPQFNAPAELADALKNAGFNVLTTANNHALDRREKGVQATLANLHIRDLLTKGTAASREEADQPLFLEKNEIKMAILAYTYGTNGIPIPDGKDYLVSLIDEPTMVKDIAAAREQGADVITIALHFGNEYQRQPNEYQQELARRLIQAGGDVILGSHPHVVQPYEFVEVEAEDGTQRKGIVIYSLGNFISNQDRSSTNKPTDIGVILSLNIRKHFPEGGIELLEVKTMPTYVHRYYSKGKRNYRVLPMESILAAKSDSILGEQDYKKLESYLAEMKQHLQSLTIPVDRKTTEQEK